MLNDDPQTLSTDEVEEEEEVKEIKQEKREQQTARRGKPFALAWSAQICKLTPTKKCSVKLERTEESPKKKEKEVVKEKKDTEIKKKDSDETKSEENKEVTPIGHIEAMLGCKNNDVEDVESLLFCKETESEKEERLKVLGKPTELQSLQSEISNMLTDKISIESTEKKIECLKHVIALLKEDEKKSQKPGIDSDKFIKENVDGEDKDIKKDSREEEEIEGGKASKDQALKNEGSEKYVKSSTDGEEGKNTSSAEKYLNKHEDAEKLKTVSESGEKTDSREEEEIEGGKASKDQEVKNEGSEKYVK